ncbi:MAG TPA: hypothetical protein VEY88_05025 [Archangium sp.]|nr:hypothetical protein [Archangium sp.]
MNEICKEQACVVDPASFWFVQPVSAVIPSTDPSDGLDWDFGSPPDVVVKMECPVDGDEPPFPVETSEDSSLTPKWTAEGCRVALSALMGKPTLIKMMDMDLSDHDEISSWNYQFTEEDIKDGAVTLFMPNQSGSLTIKIVPVQ